MSHRDLMARAWNENILYSALVELTYRCNLDCFFCYNDVGQQGTPLSTDQYDAFLADLAELQTMELILTGGEPLAHPDFFHIGGKARELGFVVRIKSNGHALGGALARRVKEEVDPFIVDISLHGSTAETHDRQTRVPGSFDQLIRNITEMKSLGLRIKFNATLTAWNEHQLVEMSQLALGLDIPMAINPSVTPRDNGDLEPLSIAPSDESLVRLYELRHRAAESLAAASLTTTSPPDGPRSVDPQKNCGAGSSGIAVDPYGNIYPCVQWRRAIGNLHQDSIKQIWAGSDDLTEVRSLTTQALERKGELGSVGKRMSFCLGLSEEKTGDPLGIDEDALREAQILDGFLEERSRSRLPIVQ